MRAERAFTRRSQGTGDGTVSMRAMEPPRDEPLPATMAFVYGLGVFIFVGWFAMYVLLRARW
jgi:hypothetical protein